MLYPLLLDVILIGDEFAPFHFLDHGSLHVILSEPLGNQVIDVRWASLIQKQVNQGRPLVYSDDLHLNIAGRS